MDNKEIKYLFRNYYRYKNNIKMLEEQVEVYRTMAEKITPSYADGGGSCGSGSKVENNVIKYEHLLTRIIKLKEKIKTADNYLAKMKSYQRHIITLCLVKNVSYERAATMEHTTSGNIKKIIDNAINTLVE